MNTGHPSPPPPPPDADRRPETKPAVSIRQVAAAAGVSIATVSRVMNKTGDVSADTAARVRKVVEEMGYAPNPMARMLGTGETRVLGIAIPWFHGEYFTELLRGADEEAVRLGSHLMVTSITTSPDGGRRNRIVGSRLVEGTVLMIEKPENPLWRDALAAGLPTVVVDTDLTEFGLDSVLLDNDKGTSEAVEHLLRWVDPSRLYFVGGPMDNFDSQRRASGFTAALARRGYTARSDQVALGEYSVDWGKEWLLRMLKGGHDIGAMAAAGVLAGNDQIAVGIMRAAESAKLWVPDQLRVVGFDDTQLSRMIRPSLSTVALGMAQVGATAIRMLVRRLDEPGAPAAAVKIPTRLVVRESSTAMTF